MVMYMVIAARGVHKVQEPYIQIKVLSASAHLDLFFQTFVSTLQRAGVGEWDITIAMSRKGFGPRQQRKKWCVTLITIALILVGDR